MDQDKKLRREIANCNERRRMQSINAGFQSLKALLPHFENEKLSKAAILHQASQHITNLEKELRLVSTDKKRLTQLLTGRLDLDSTQSSSPKRIKTDTESSDEGISLRMDNDPGLEDNRVEDLRREMSELRAQLECERQARIVCEKQLLQLEYLNQLNITSRIIASDSVKPVSSAIDATHYSLSKNTRVISPKTANQQTCLFLPVSADTAPLSVQSFPAASVCEAVLLSASGAHEKTGKCNEDQCEDSEMMQRSQCLVESVNEPMCSLANIEIAASSNSCQEAALVSQTFSTSSAPTPSNPSRDSTSPSDPTPDHLPKHEIKIKTSREINLTLDQKPCVSVSRRNLETIVEAIKHVEGDTLGSTQTSLAPSPSLDVSQMGLKSISVNKLNVSAVDCSSSSSSLAQIQLVSTDSATHSSDSTISNRLNLQDMLKPVCPGVIVNNRS